MRFIALALALLPAAAWAAPAPDGAALLNGLHAQVLATVKAGQQPVVVFDLDATLFDNRPRTLAILRAFAAQPGQAGTAAAKAIGGLALDQVRYGVKDTLAQIGVTDAPTVEAVTAYWLDRFFGAWAVHDAPMAGGPAYVQRLHADGAFVVYLTGRDAPRMLAPTTESLALSGYPIGEVRTQLIMKPNRRLDDEVFKDSVMTSLRHTGQVLAFFDNEPGNVNLMKAAFPKAQVVFLDTMHRPDAPAVAPGIPAIKDFTR